MADEPTPPEETIGPVPPKAPIRKKAVAKRPQMKAKVAGIPGRSPIVTRKMGMPTPAPLPDAGPGPEGDAGAQTSVLVLSPDETGDFDLDDSPATSHPARTPMDVTGKPATPGVAKSLSETDQVKPAETSELNVMGSSSQTIHIQLPDLGDLDRELGKSPRTVAGPPTVRLKAPSTVRVKKFATGIVEAKAKEEGVPVSSVQGRDLGNDAKKATSRVPLSAARATAPIPSAKTVRIKPAASTGGAPVPGSRPLPAGPKPPSQAQVQAAKSKTSRISLEAALTGEPAEPEAGAPKTIRLKRPSEVATVKMKPVPGAQGTPAVATAVAARAAKSSTAKIPDSGEGGTPLTRRKTIRVKRPASRPTVSGAKSDAGAEAVPVAEGVVEFAPPVIMPAVDTVNPFFPIAAIAAMLAMMALLWVLSSQLFGPNASLTELSYGGPDFAMPNSVSVN